MTAIGVDRLVINYYKVARFILSIMIIYSFIGSSPFATESGQLDYTETGGGNLFRQLFFSLSWLLSLLVFIRLGNSKDFYKLPCFLLMILWCVLSVLWAVEPSISIRRVFLFSMNVATLLMLVSVLSKEDIIDTLAWTFAGLLIISLISIPFIPGAVHQHGELFDSGLAGNWKGIFIHKNLGAPAAVFGIFLFIFKAIETKNRSWFLLALLGLIFVFFSRSKTSLALILPSLVLAYLISSFFINVTAKKVMLVITVTVILLSAFLHEYVLLAFNKIIDDPEAFTGRSTIWNLIYLALQDNFWLGLGFGSVWQVGDNMVLATYAFGWVDWVFSLSHSHNGLLEAFISVGFIGFILSILCFFVLPFNKIVFGTHANYRFLYSSFFFFFLVHNMIETDILNASDGRWFVFLIIYFLVYLKNDDVISSVKKGS